MENDSSEITKEEFWDALTWIPVKDRNCENCGFWNNWKLDCGEPTQDITHEQTCNFYNDDDIEYIEKFYNKYGQSLPMWKPKQR